jgi:hypothetical protein
MDVGLGAGPLLLKHPPDPGPGPDLPHSLGLHVTSRPLRLGGTSIIDSKPGWRVAEPGPFSRPGAAGPEGPPAGRG